MSAIDNAGHPRIAWWSPWPPARSGIAEYSLSLVEALRHLAQVNIFVADQAIGRAMSLPGVSVLPAGAFRSEHARQPFDAAVFHLGNQAGHAYMADALLSAPCRRIAVLHDGSLYHLYEGISRWRLLREIAAEEGWFAAWRAWQRMRLPGSDSYNHPLLRRICRASDLLVAHSAFLAERLRTAAPATPVTVLPYGVTAYTEDGGALQTQARRALDLPAGALLFGVFGHITAAKRVEQIIEAFVRSDLPQSWLYIAGEVTPLAPEAVRRWAEDPTRCALHRIRFEAAYRTPLYVLLGMQAVDIGITLRFPTTGETSAVLSDLLSMGKPTIVSEIGAFRELPDDCVIKVPTDENEIAGLSAAMRRLSLDPPLRTRMASAARAYSAGRTWDIVAQSYLKMVSTP
ncbi:MAG: glycosyltransferase family 4 protein [Anaerolineae bacterium]|nr:glycosyltransferase family 4 protein [Thermoflexales bacterium]MDW8407484.1 glycosyltransferase family 4 protein [Anaerolineae bacterium]